MMATTIAAEPESLIRATLAKVDLVAAASMSCASDSSASSLIPVYRDGSAAAGSEASTATSSSDGSSGSVPSTPTAAAQSPLALPASPAAKPRSHTKLLALCPTVPPSMHRDCWCMADYRVLEKLYTGYASKVYKAVCKRTNEVVVLKSYQLSSICALYQHQIFREVGLHASLTHENVVKLYAAFQEGDFVIMVQEFADGGDLFNLLQKYGGRLSERVTVSLVLEPFLRVLQYLHTRGIVHRDIKPENILFSGGMCLKLADFGLAIDLRQERAVTRAGTLDYMAPEVLNCPYKNKPEENKEKAHLHYGSTVDSWAVGVLAYELLVGCPPFYDQSRERVEARIRAAQPVFPRSMSEEARNFVSAALTKDPRVRPTVMQLLQHPWVNTYRTRRSMRQVGPAGSPNATEEAPDGRESRVSALNAKPATPRTDDEGSNSAAASPRGQLGTSSLVPPASVKGAAAAALSKAGEQQHGSQQHQLPPVSPRNARGVAAAASSKHSGHLGLPSLQAIEAGLARSQRPLKLSSSLAAKRPGAAAAAVAPSSRSAAAAAAAESLRVQASAHSSPLMVAGDLRTLGLRGVGAAVPHDEDAGAATGERQRKKWLQSIRLWPSGAAK